LVNTERGDRNKLSLVKKKQPCEEAEAMKIKNMKILRIVLRSTVDGSPPAKKKGKEEKLQVKDRSESR